LEHINYNKLDKFENLTHLKLYNINYYNFFYNYNYNNNNLYKRIKSLEINNFDINNFNDFLFNFNIFINNSLKKLKLEFIYDKNNDFNNNNNDNNKIINLIIDFNYFVKLKSLKLINNIKQRNVKLVRMININNNINNNNIKILHLKLLFNENFNILPLLFNNLEELKIDIIYSEKLFRLFYLYNFTIKKLRFLNFDNNNNNNNNNYNNNNKVEIDNKIYAFTLRNALLKNINKFENFKLFYDININC
jgi:hypothetical protein